MHLKHIKTDKQKYNKTISPGMRQRTRFNVTIPECTLKLKFHSVENWKSCLIIFLKVNMVDPQKYSKSHPLTLTVICFFRKNIIRWYVFIYLTLRRQTKNKQKLFSTYSNRNNNSFNVNPFRFRLRA